MGGDSLDDVRGPNQRRDRAGRPRTDLRRSSCGDGPPAPRSDRRGDVRPAFGRRDRRRLARTARRSRPAAQARDHRGGAARGVRQCPGGRLGDASLHRRRNGARPARPLGRVGRRERVEIDPTAAHDALMSHILPTLPLASLSVKTPSGPAWEFLILFLVVILGPPIVRRFRGPGIVGLIVGGYVIGPYGLNLIGAGDQTVPELGQLGLLYLMFVAGVELDLALVRIHRKAVAGFAALTFAFPLTFGYLVGFSLDWNVSAALLLGALLSSHTLLLYPTVRQAGLSAETGVAAAVGPLGLPA